MGESYDPWATQDTKSYSLDEVYSRSTDGRGHSANLGQVKVSPEMAGEIGALVASGVIPEYRTAQDFVRDAVVHRLAYWAEKQKNGDLQRRVTIEAMMARRDRQKAEIDNMTGLLEKTENTLWAARTAEDWAMLEAIVAEAEGDIELVHEPYKGKLMAIVKKYQDELKRRKK